jgi:hypothetical protein
MWSNEVSDDRTPVYGTRPNVAFKPTIPQNEAGWGMSDETYASVPKRQKDSRLVYFHLGHHQYPWIFLHYQ